MEVESNKCKILWE